MSLRASVLGSLCIAVLVTVQVVAQTSPSTPEPATSAAPAASAAGAAADEPTLQAREHFAEATVLYKDGHFAAALVQFERAYARHARSAE